MKKGEENIMKKNLFIATALLTTVMSFNAFAGEWYQQEEDWYYTDTSEHWVKSGEDWYYIDDAGKMMKNYVTPDGYYCSFSGRMVNQEYDAESKTFWDNEYYKGSNAAYAFYAFGDSTALDNLSDKVREQTILDTNMGFLDTGFSPYDKRLYKDTVYGYDQVDTLKYVQSVLDPIAEEAVKLPEYERAGFLYDRVVDMLDYGYPEYKSTEELKNDKRDLWGACVDTRDVGPTLIAKKGLCLEYSNVYRRLCNLAGLDCAVISNGDHAWNVVKINGKLYYFDTSSADTGVTGRKYAETDKPWDYTQSEEYIKAWEDYEKEMENWTPPELNPIHVTEFID